MWRSYTDGGQHLGSQSRTSMTATKSAYLCLSKSSKCHRMSLLSLESRPPPLRAIPSREDRGCWKQHKGDTTLAWYILHKYPGHHRCGEQTWANFFNFLSSGSRSASHNSLSVSAEWNKTLSILFLVDIMYVTYTNYGLEFWCCKYLPRYKYNENPSHFKWKYKYYCNSHQLP